MEKVIIGLIGSMGSGKSTAMNYLATKYGASKHSFSEMLKEILEYLNLSITRENLIDLILALMERFGEDVLAKPMKEKVLKDKKSLIVVESIRRPADIKELKKIPNFYLIGITAEEKIRYQRIYNRGQRADDKKTYEEFLKDHKRKTELLVDDLVKGADFKVDNSKDQKSLEESLDKIMSKLGHNNKKA